jgi:hypothetical protein
MSRRFALIAAACLFVASIPSSTVAQQASKPSTAAPTTATPPAPAKFVPPIKGQGTVEFMQGKPQRVKGEIVTKFKLRNTSKGAIALLTVDELWYNTKRELASNGTYKHRAHLQPGEIIEFEIKSPEKPDLYSNNLMFKHANGTIDAKRVSKLQ